MEPLGWSYWLVVKQGSLFFHMRGRRGRESIWEVVIFREGLKKLMLRTAVFNYLPPKFQGKSDIFTIFCKKCPGRYWKVMEEWRSLWWNAVADFGYVCPLLSNGGKLASRIFCISTMQQVLMEVKLSSSLIWAWPSSAPACSTYFFYPSILSNFFLETNIFFYFQGA